jgi:hypothetical protein
MAIERPQAQHVNHGQFIRLHRGQLSFPAAGVHAHAANDNIEKLPQSSWAGRKGAFVHPTG